MDAELVDRVYEANINKPGAKVRQRGGGSVSAQQPRQHRPDWPPPACRQGPACWFDPELRQFVDKIFKKSGLGAPPPPPPQQQQQQQRRRASSLLAAHLPRPCGPWP